MKKSKVISYLIVVLVILTAVLAVYHVTTRTSVPKQKLLVKYQEKEVTLDFAALPFEDVKGTLVNGKGEQSEINGKGCSLSVVLQKALGDISALNSASAYASDEYHAIVNSDEWNVPGTVYLLNNGDSIQMVVFGDSNSKRNVRNVERLVVE